MKKTTKKLPKKSAEKLADFLDETSKQIRAGLSEKEIEGRIFRMKCFMEQIETPPKPPRPKTSEADLKRHLKSLAVNHQIFEAASLIYVPASRKKMQEKNENFMNALYAIAGMHEGYGSEMLRALQSPEAASFFESTLAAISATKISNAARKRNDMGIKSTPQQFALHVFHTLRILGELDRDRKPEPTKSDLQKLVSQSVHRDGGSAYFDAKDWTAVWRAAGCSHLKTKFIGRSQKTSGKGRE